MEAGQTAIDAPGERDLSTLLSTLTASLDPKIYAFVNCRAESLSSILTKFAPQMIFMEAEGITLIADLSDQEAEGLPYAFPCRMITLNVQSSLSAVGFLAVITDRLKKKNMPVNPVSAFYHDYLFVPQGREEEAMEVLKDIAKEAAGS